MVRLYVSVPPRKPPSRKSLSKNSARMASRLAAKGSAVDMGGGPCGGTPGGGRWEDDIAPLPASQPDRAGGSPRGVVRWPGRGWREGRERVSWECANPSPKGGRGTMSTVGQPRATIEDLYKVEGKAELIGG